jgi:hypothetical protein
VTRRSAERGRAQLPRRGGHSRWRRAAAAIAVVALASGALGPRSAGAQQYITDDAAVTDYRACQVQMWTGQRSAWVLPVCTPIRNLELSLGFIAVWRDGGDGHFEYVAQAKTALRPLTTGGWGAGLVVGTGRDPAFAGTGNPTYNLYAYVPATLSLGADRVLLDANLGGLYDRSGGRGAGGVTWATRADVATIRRITLVAEAYGERGLGRSHLDATPEFQAGVRKWLRTDHVQLDLSYGGQLEGRHLGGHGAGWTAGLTLITPPFL